MSKAVEYFGRLSYCFQNALPKGLRSRPTPETAPETMPATDNAALRRCDGMRMDELLREKTL
jgi:hypothetical protein